MLTDEFHFRTISLPDDYEGKVTATFIEAKANHGQRKSVLYIHGWSDYFFHPHVARQFDVHGYDFYALELRKFGNSLLSHQHPNYCRSIEEYFEEISRALREIRKNSKQPIILLGHSTGGLITALYMNSGVERGLVSALILNSPFLEMNVSRFSRVVMPFVAGTIASILPYSKVENTVSPVYNQSLHKDYFGEWDFNKDWKPINHFPTYFTWLSTVSDAQSKLKNHSAINVPTLILHSAKSINPKTMSEEAQKSDCVLNVEHIRQIGPKLGKDITMIEIEGAVHDIFLSKEEVRNHTFQEMFGWIEKRFDE